MQNNINAEELYHYGVKGMKWGVRRYQRKDGTLTAAGKRRYSKELRDKIVSSGKQGKAWYEISEEISKDAAFKSEISRRSELRDARQEFGRLSAQRDKMYESQSKKLSKKELSKLVDEEIEKNRDFYQDWKPRFFNKDGSPTSELKMYVEDGILSERASKDTSFKEVDDAYNKAWKRYDSLQKEAVNDLIGRYAHEYIETGSKTYGTMSVSARQIMDSAIYSAAVQLEIERELKKR